MVSKRLVIDLLFFGQIIFSVIFCSSQILHMINNGITGLSISLVFSVELFVVLNLVLAAKANRIKPTRLSKQIIVIYSIWTLLWGIGILVVLYYIISSQGLYWDIYENITVVILVAGLVGIQIWKWKKKLPAADPIVVACQATIFKSLP